MPKLWHSITIRANITTYDFLLHCRSLLAQNFGIVCTHRRLTRFRAWLTLRTSQFINEVVPERVFDFSSHFVYRQFRGHYQVDHYLPDIISDSKFSDSVRGKVARIWSKARPNYKPVYQMQNSWLNFIQVLKLCLLHVTPVLVSCMHQISSPLQYTSQLWKGNLATTAGMWVWIHRQNSLHNILNGLRACRSVTTCTYN